jgi:hypothetical protein
MNLVQFTHFDNQESWMLIPCTFLQLSYEFSWSGASFPFRYGK